MGGTNSKENGPEAPGVIGKLGGLPRAAAITAGGGKRTKGGQPVLPPNTVKSQPEDWQFIEGCLSKMLLMGKLEASTQQRVVQEMYERKVTAGEILIKEGDTGLAASELYVVKEGEFEVLERRQGVNFRVNMKNRGDCFGEISLMYNSPRSATVAATQESTVWVLERDIFRYHVREIHQDETSQVELFLNSVPILSSLTRDEKMMLVDALEEQVFAPAAKVINQGDAGDLFYIIKEGEAVVYQSTAQGTRKVNHLFKADFFGERALLCDEPRIASVEAQTRLVCLTLRREVFVEILGPLEQLMTREKSPQVITQRLLKLQTTPTHMPAELKHAEGVVMVLNACNKHCLVLCLILVHKRKCDTYARGSAALQKALMMVLIKRRKRARGGADSWEVVRARGHLDEVQELKSAEAAQALAQGRASKESMQLVLTEGAVLGGGAFSRVSIVTEESTDRAYALKRMRKSAVVQCPEHVFCEQAITRNTAHPFCIRQYASFQDKYHLYFLFDLMSGGDLMDVLVAEAKVIKRRIPQGAWRRACLAPKVKMLKGMDEQLAKFYIASIVLALEYLHHNNIVYRDLKPENVFIDLQGFVKLGDFGFAKILENANRTYTFCGTPGYVAPENVLAHGYNYSVDWWGLGVLLYVLLTGRQPFSSPKTDDPMVVMRRIVDENWHFKYPPYLSAAAKDLVGRLLERKPARRLGMLSGRATDIKKHKWFEGMDWEALEARKLVPMRKPKEDSAKRLKELTDNEKKQKREPKETPEELQECEMVFKDF